MVNMKHVLQFITVFIILFVMPVVVFAERVESNLASTTDIIREFEVGRVNITNVGYTRYSNILSTGRAGVLFDGTVTNNYVRDIELEITLNVYNKSKKIIEKRISVVSVPANGKTVYNQYLYADEIDISLDDISYYSLEADILSDVEILEEWQSDKYYLENYSVIVNVSEKNVYTVQENFDAVFNNHIGALSKGIPFRHIYVRSDGTKVNKRAIISDIVVDDYYKLSTEDGIRYVKMGKEDKANTRKSYKLNYNYNVGRDSLKGKDEFVFYLVNDLTVKTDGVSFKIVLPKDFNKENIKFIDKNGIEIENVTYSVDGNVITGRINDVVNPGVSYAISIELEDGYFINCTNNISKVSIMSLIIPLIFMTIAITIYVVTKKSNEKVVFNNIYFNEKINSLELGYLFNGKVKDNDIASLLFCLTNKGYIDIVKNKKTYTLVKKRDYAEDDRVEMAFMKELFFAHDEITKKELLVSLTDLKDAITIKLENKNKRKKKLYNKKIFNYKLLFWIMIVLIIILNITNIFIEYQPKAILINSILTVIGYILLLNSVLSKGKVIEKFLYTLVALILIVSPIVLTSYQAYLQDILYLVIYVIGIVSILIIACISSTMSDRTKYGNRMLNKITAYKKYLTECDEKVIDNGLRLNNNCIYEVLPYTLVLGISDRWIDKFRDKNLEKPVWYISSEKFELKDFYLDILNIYSDIFIALKKNEEDNLK